MRRVEDNLEILQLHAYCEDTTITWEKEPADIWLWTYGIWILELTFGSILFFILVTHIHSSLFSLGDTFPTHSWSLVSGEDATTRSSRTKSVTKAWGN